MKYIDISVYDFNGQYTRRAHQCGVQTQILLKVPAEKLTTVRLKATTVSEIENFLRLEGWKDWLVQMHLRAAKTLTVDNQAPAHKNRWISEQRARSPAMIAIIMRLLGYKQVKILHVEYLEYLSNIFQGCVIEIGLKEDWEATARPAFVFGKLVSRESLLIQSETMTPAYRIMISGVVLSEQECFRVEYVK